MGLKTVDARIVVFGFIVQNLRSCVTGTFIVFFTESISGTFKLDLDNRRHGSRVLKTLLSWLFHTGDGHSEVRTVNAEFGSTTVERMLPRGNFIPCDKLSK